MPWRLALDVFGDYYTAFFYYFRILKRCFNHGIYEEYIKSFFAELENSGIDDLNRKNFVKYTISAPCNFYPEYYSNRSCIEKGIFGKEQCEKWNTDQEKGLSKFEQLNNLTLERLNKKYEGFSFSDEEKYQKFAELIVASGSTFNCHFSSESKFILENLYTYYVTQGRIGVSDFLDVKKYLEEPRLLDNVIDNDSQFIWWQASKEYLKQCEQSKKNDPEEKFRMSYEEFAKLYLESKSVEQKKIVSLSKEYDEIPRVFDNVTYQKSLSEQWLEEKEAKKLKNRVKRLFRRKGN